MEDDRDKRPALYKHKWLGEPYNQERKIYKDWNFIDEIPHEARLERYGLDFGYSNDPTAIVAIYKYNGGFIFDEICYQKGLSNKQIADILNNQERKSLCIADSAEPKSIDEIMMYGISILPSKKGQGSVLQGIQYVQDQRISVTKRSINIIKEYKNFLWKVDKDGKIINEPEHSYKHCFVAGTKVLTRRGNIDIENINVGDFVWSPFGWNEVWESGCVGKKIVKDYGIFTCTPNHKIFTNKGLQKVDCISYSDIILVWKQEKKHFLMEYLIDDTQVQKIEVLHYILGGLLKKAIKSKYDFYIEKFGNSIMVKFLMGISYITLMGTLVTMILKILSVSLLVNMLKNITGVFGKAVKNILIKLDHLLKNGTLQKRVEIGIRKLVALLIKIELKLKKYAKYAEKNMSHTFVKANTVIQTVPQKHLEKEFVYNLTTKFGCYFANGVLVSNSMDAISYGLNDLRPNDEDNGSLPDDTQMFNEGFY